MVWCRLSPFWFGIFAETVWLCHASWWSWRLYLSTSTTPFAVDWEITGIYSCLYINLQIKNREFSSELDGDRLSQRLHCNRDRRWRHIFRVGNGSCNTVRNTKQKCLSRIGFVSIYARLRQIRTKLMLILATRMQILARLVLKSSFFYP